ALSLLLPLSLHDALPIYFLVFFVIADFHRSSLLYRIVCHRLSPVVTGVVTSVFRVVMRFLADCHVVTAYKHRNEKIDRENKLERSEEHTSELQSRENLVC